MGGCLVRLLVWSLLPVAVTLGLLGVGWLWLDATLPDVYGVDRYREVARESTRVYAAGGEVVARFGEEIRTVVPAERMTPTMRVAMICAEDAAFFSHPGLDLLGIARAIWIDVSTGRYAQGASTITQQLAKTRFLTREKTVSRKLKELVLARKLESMLSKDDILTIYLNEVYFGHGRYGVEEAARFFFGKGAAQLDLAEAALLAGLVNSPSRLSPIRHPARAKQRRQYVLEQMHKRGYINASDLQRALETPLPTKPAEADLQVGDWYLEAVRRQALELVGKERLQTGGLRIEIALDVGLQRAAEAAVRDGLARLDAQYAHCKPVDHLGSDVDRAKLLRKLAETQTSPRSGQILLGLVVEEDKAKQRWLVELGPERGWLQAADLQRYHGAGCHGIPKPKKGAPEPADMPMRPAPGDVLRVSVRERGKDADGQPWAVLAPEFGPQAALVAIEPKTRLVRALVGGDNFDLHPFDRTKALRQPGSTFKPFTYGAAIEAGQIGADTPFVDEKRSFKAGGKLWTPRNFSGKYDGKTYRVRDALAHSINSIAVEIAHRVGPEAVVEFARKLGIDSPLVAGLPIALGASSVTPLELTNAYATIAAGGLRAKPILITQIADKQGNVLFAARTDETQRVLSEDLAKVLTDLLGEVVRTGSGKEAQRAGRPVAGKTGTSNGGRDVWFVGFSADLVAGVWIGHDDRRPMAKASGGTLAVPLWTEFVRNGLVDVPPTPLPRLPAALAPVALPPAASAEAIDDEATEALGDDDVFAPEPEPPAAASEPLPPRRPPPAERPDPDDDATTP